MAMVSPPHRTGPQVTALCGAIKQANMFILKHKLPAFKKKIVFLLFEQHSARAEESRLQQERADKEMRLRQFQEDVKKRVSELARLKRQHELEKSYKAVRFASAKFAFSLPEFVLFQRWLMSTRTSLLSDGLLLECIFFVVLLSQVEDERNIVRQTFHAAERVTPRKNRCYLRNSDDLAIQLRKNGSLGEADISCQMFDQTSPLWKLKSIRVTLLLPLWLLLS